MFLCITVEKKQLFIKYIHDIIVTSFFSGQVPIDLPPLKSHRPEQMLLLHQGQCGPAAGYE